MKLQNYIIGKWIEGSKPGTALTNPTTGKILAYADSTGINTNEALEYSRKIGSPNLQKLNYSQRTEILMKMAETLSVNRDKYYKIAAENSGNTISDAKIDIDGGIGTLKYFSTFGSNLGYSNFLIDAQLEHLARDKNFQATHISTPLTGVAIQINAFNFPSWGMWEKVAVSFLSGVPAFIKPATSTSLLSHEMFKDVIEANIVPVGSLSLICGGAHDLMDHVHFDDVVLFTGSAETAFKLKSNVEVIRSNVRFNAETDSLNLTILAEDVTKDSPLLDSFINSIVKEMTIKAGQKCTAIRRIFVPTVLIQIVGSRLKDKLLKITIGDPQNDKVQLGPLVDIKQHQSAITGIKILKEEADLICGSLNDYNLVGENIDESCFMAPTLLRCDNPMLAKSIHEIEIFGPAATLMPYENYDQLWTLATKGKGSLVGSIFSNNKETLVEASIKLSTTHGRILMINDEIKDTNTGHGVVMPQCIHGGPGRAGGGQELGGLRSLAIYHQQTAVQTNLDTLHTLQSKGAIQN